MKVRITKCDGPWWYSDDIGSVFEAKLSMGKKWYIIPNNGVYTGRSIMAEDCEIVKEENNMEREEKIKYAQAVWVSNDASKWEKRYYVGRLSDRSYPFAVCKFLGATRSYPNGQLNIETYKFLSAVPVNEYRPFKDGIEAVSVIGKRVKSKKTGASRYVAVYKTGVLLHVLDSDSQTEVIEDEYKFIPFDRAFVEYEFASDGSPFGVKEE